LIIFQKYLLIQKKTLRFYLKALIFP